MDNRSKIIAAAAVKLSTDLLSAFDLLPPYFDTSDEEQETAEPRRIPVRNTSYLENVVPHLTDRQFQQHFRVNRRTFEKLFPIIASHLKKDNEIGRSILDPEKQFLSVLWLLATPDSFRSVGDRFNMGKSSVSDSFFKIIKILNLIAAQFIKWPTAHQKPQIKHKFERMGGLQGVIGAIDGTFIRIKTPKNDAEAYVTRKCFYAITLQAICDPALSFLNCYVGYPGSVSDTRIFRNSDIYHKIINNINTYFDDGEYIVGDKAYPVYFWCIPPYINRGNMTAAKRNFNLKLSQTRQTIERSFALLFGRFRRLKFLDMNRFDMLPATVLAACVLHNVCLHNNDIYLEEYINEGAPHINGNEEIENENLHAQVQQNGHERRENICRQLFEEII